MKSAHQSKCKRQIGGAAKQQREEHEGGRDDDDLYRLEALNFAPPGKKKTDHRRREQMFAGSRNLASRIQKEWNLRNEVYT